MIIDFFSILNNIYVQGPPHGSYGPGGGEFEFKNLLIILFVGIVLYYFFTNRKSINNK